MMRSPLMKARTDRRSGNALVEYVILLIAVSIFVLTIVLEYGQSVEGEWARTNEDSAWDTVSENLEGGDGDGDEGCPYYYNPATGRWHDPDTHLFVSFEDAGGSGCS